MRCSQKRLLHNTPAVLSQQAVIRPTIFVEQRFKLILIDITEIYSPMRHMKQFITVPVDLHQFIDRHLVTVYTNPSTELKAIVVCANPRRLLAEVYEVFNDADCLLQVPIGYNDVTEVVHRIKFMLIRT